VLFIYRQDQYVERGAPDAEANGFAEIIIGKQRNGPTGVVKLAFIREFTRFENLALGTA
jgi:replicative DNA helicase